MQEPGDSPGIEVMTTRAVGSEQSAVGLSIAVAAGTIESRLLLFVGPGQPEEFLEVRRHLLSHGPG